MHEPRSDDAPQHVLLWMPGGKRVLGGHVVQLEKTADALRHAGLTVDTSYSATPEQTEIDLVHGFGLSAADIRQWHSGASGWQSRRSTGTGPIGPESGATT